MFIFAPGAGCSGEAKLVKFGDELIFSSEKDWEERGGPCLVVSPDKCEGALASRALPAQLPPSPANTILLYQMMRLSNLAIKTFQKRP